MGSVLFRVEDELVGASIVRVVVVYNLYSGKVVSFQVGDERWLGFCWSFHYESCDCLQLVRLKWN